MTSVTSENHVEDDLPPLAEKVTSMHKLRTGVENANSNIMNEKLNEASNTNLAMKEATIRITYLGLAATVPLLSARGGRS
jgi:hypothetical protein